MDLAAFGPEDGGERGVASGERRPAGECGGGRNAVRETYRGAFTVVATSADTPGLDAELVRDCLHREPRVAEKGQVGFDAVFVRAEDADHLIPNLGGVYRGENSRTAQQAGYLARRRFASQVRDQRVRIENCHLRPVSLRSSLAASSDRFAARMVSTSGPSFA